MAAMKDGDDPAIVAKVIGDALGPALSHAGESCRLTKHCTFRRMWCYRVANLYP
jgi:hypothetical protein